MQRSRKQGEKTSETWFERGSVEFVRVFVGRSHPLSFGVTYQLFDLDSIFPNFLSQLSTSSQLFQLAPVSSKCFPTFQKVEGIVRNFANNMKKLTLGEEGK